MRGTPFAGKFAALERGIIPAYAGNTLELLGSYPHAWDHPRVCGEHVSHILLTGTVEGSSPRMRGTRTFQNGHSQRVGIIPAYAGNTATYSTEDTNIRDHPRVCGEHAASSRLSTSRTGSSPRMRGTHRLIYRRASWRFPSAEPHRRTGWSMRIRTLSRTS